MKKGGCIVNTMLRVLQGHSDDEYGYFENDGGAHCYEYMLKNDNPDTEDEFEYISNVRDVYNELRYKFSQEYLGFLIIESAKRKLHGIMLMELFLSISNNYRMILKGEVIQVALMNAEYFDCTANAKYIDDKLIHMLGDEEVKEVKAQTCTRCGNRRK